MTRAIFGEALLFFLPFAAFALYLVLRRRNPLSAAAWSGQVSWLVVAGLACAILALLYTGLTAERRTGPYVPTHMENGRLVPGQFK
ncbi:MAG TPA: DUF6111 family protein [Microvirga sp.]|jgi:hypothetical protein|nr:DUF6111 family protein [Microvirga sp.]